MSPIRAVIFDLDGTLVQTRVASWEVFKKVSQRFGLGVDRPEQYFELFQGNVFASIRELCRDDAHAAEVKQYFLQLLRDEYAPPLVPGVADVVRRLAADCTLAVMSSNATQVLRRVLESNGLAFCFAHVFGGDVMPDKRAAVRAFLADAGSGFGRRCSADYDEAGRAPAPDAAGTVLVTDTAGDVRDALEVGIRAVGVSWGMHSVDELVGAGAEFVALWPQELAAHLLGDAAARPAEGACAVPEAPRADGSTNASCECGRGGRRAPTATEPTAAGGPGSPCGAAASRAVVGGTTAYSSAVATAAAVRRQRRRAAAARLTGPGPVTAGGRRAPAEDELLAAIRRVCRT